MNNDELCERLYQAAEMLGKSEASIKDGKAYSLNIISDDEISDRVSKLINRVGGNAFSETIESYIDDDGIKKHYIIDISSIHNNTINIFAICFIR